MVLRVFSNLMILWFYSRSPGVCGGQHWASPISLWGGFRHIAMSPGGCARDWGWWWGCCSRPSLQAVTCLLPVLWTCVWRWILSLSVIFSSSVHLACRNISLWTCSSVCWSVVGAKLPLAFPRGRRFPLAAGVQWLCTGVVHSVWCLCWESMCFQIAWQCWVFSTWRAPLAFFC